MTISKYYTICRHVIKGDQEGLVEIKDLCPECKKKPKPTIKGRENIVTCKYLEFWPQYGYSCKLPNCPWDNFCARRVLRTEGG